jgi:hypothetical protein
VNTAIWQHWAPAIFPQMHSSLIDITNDAITEVHDVIIITSYYAIVKSTLRKVFSHSKSQNGAVSEKPFRSIFILTVFKCLSLYRYFTFEKNILNIVFKRFFWRWWSKVGVRRSRRDSNVVFAQSSSGTESCLKKNINLSKNFPDEKLVGKILGVGLESLATTPLVFLIN